MKLYSPDLYELCRDILIAEIGLDHLFRIPLSDFNRTLKVTKLEKKRKKKYIYIYIYIYFFFFNFFIYLFIFLIFKKKKFFYYYLILSSMHNLSYLVLNAQPGIKNLEIF